MSGRIYCIKVFGAFSFGAKDGPSFPLGAKQQALLALLAAAPDGTRTRSWLQAHLWTNVQPAQAKGSLRNALSALRRIIGSGADDIIVSTRERVTLDPACVQVLGDARDGAYLEGLDLRHEKPFADWLGERRAAQDGAVRAPARHRRDAGLLVEGAAPASDMHDLFDPLPDVAVLPFRSRAAEAACPFGGAMAEDVSRALSRSRVFTVASHLSCRHFASMNASLPVLATKLQSRFMVTGETICHDGRFRTNIDFHDTRSMKLLWTREYFGAIDDFLSGEMDMSRDVVAHAARAAMAAAQSAARAEPPSGLAVHEMLMAAIAMMHSDRPGDFQTAKRMLDAAIARAPGRSPLHAWRGKWHVLKVQKGFGDDRAAEAALAMDETARALDLDPFNALALSFDGFVHAHLSRRSDLAEARYRQAIDADPNDAFAWLMFSALHAFRSDPSEAMRIAARAQGRSSCGPRPHACASPSAAAELLAGNYQKALDLADTAMAAPVRAASMLRVKAIALQQLGRAEDARVAATELMVHEPDLTVTGHLMRRPSAVLRTGGDRP